jgi:chromosome segregation ATPase
MADQDLKLSAMAEENEKLAAAGKSLEQEVARSSQAAGKAKSDLDDLNKRADAAHLGASSREAEVKELTAEKDRFEIRASELSAQLEALRAENSRLALAGKDAAAQDATVARLRLEVKQAGQKAAQSPGASATDKGVVKDLSGNARLEEAKAVFEWQTGEFQREADSGRAEIAALHEREASEANTAGAHIAELQAGNAAAENELAEKDRKIAELIAANTGLAAANLAAAKAAEAMRAVLAAQEAREKTGK